VKLRNEAGETALFWAVLTGNGGPSRRLVEQGADVKTTDLRGNTLLHAAADGAHAELTSAFLSLGVDPRQRNKNGKRPYDIAKERGYTELVKLLERFQRE
jgi:ankyrin repeat protein